MPFKIHIDLEKKEFINYLLLPFAIIFSILSSIRRILYQLKILKNYKAKVPIIVVGNITVGGTGKTPIVINLVNFFIKKNKKVGVVSRGYGRLNKNLVVVNENSIAQDCGDEPLLIHKITNAIVVVSSNRVKAVKILEDLNVDIIISDDGLQHYAMQRDIEIVVIRGFANGFLLPAGGLRETITRLKKVDFVLDNKFVEFKNINFVNTKTGEIKALNYFHQIKCFAFCGIAKPELFFTNLRLLGLEIETKVFSDHYNYCQNDFIDFINLEKPIIMTAKDWVKCQNFVTKNMWYLQIEVVIKNNFYQQLEKKLCLLKNY